MFSDGGDVCGGVHDDVCDDDDRVRSKHLQFYVRVLYDHDDGGVHGDDDDHYQE